MKRNVTEELMGDSKFSFSYRLVQICLIQISFSKGDQSVKKGTLESGAGLEPALQRRDGQILEIL